MRQYSIDRVELSWASIDIKAGIAQGTSIVEAKTTPQQWTMKADGVGGVVRVYNPDSSGTLTVTVDQESRLHQQLRTIWLADVAARNQVFPGVLKDISSGETFKYVNMFILGEPDEGRGTESATFAWVFGFEKRDAQPALADANIVGS